MNLRSTGATYKLMGTMALMLTQGCLASQALALIPNLSDQVLEAAFYGDLEAFKNLRKQHADFTIRSKKFDATALHWVIFKCTGEKRQQCVEFLLNETSIDINAQNEHGQTPLELAARMNDWDTVVLLLQHNSVHVQNKIGSELLFHYLSTEKEQLVTRKVLGDKLRAQERAQHQESRSKKEAEALKEKQERTQAHRKVVQKNMKAFEEIWAKKRESFYQEISQQERELESTRHLYTSWSFSSNHSSEEQTAQEKAAAQHEHSRESLKQKRTAFEEDMKAAQAQKSEHVKAEDENYLQHEADLATTLKRELDAASQELETRLAREEQTQQDAIDKASCSRLTLEIAHMLLKKGAPMTAQALEVILDMNQDERAQLSAYAQEQELIDIVRLTYYTNKLDQHIKAGTDINALSRMEGLSNPTALSFAVVGGKQGMVDKLIQAGAHIKPVSAIDLFNAQPGGHEVSKYLESYHKLYEAAQSGNEHEVSLLIARGLWAQARYDKGDTLLHAATSQSTYSSAQAKALLVLKILLAAGADPLAVNLKGQTFLHGVTHAKFIVSITQLLGTEKTQALAAAMTLKDEQEALLKALQPAEGM